MYEALKPRQQLRSPSGTVYEVGKFLGAGSQGEVYRVTAGGADYAVKWYLPGFATAEQRGGDRDPGQGRLALARVPLADRARRGPRHARVRLRHAAPRPRRRLDRGPDEGPGQPVLPRARDGRARARRGLPPAPRGRPLLQGHLVRQRLLRPENGPDRGRRHRQRHRRRHGAAGHGQRHPAVHGPRDRPERGRPVGQHGPLQPRGPALLHVHHLPPARGAARDRDPRLRRAGHAPDLRRGPGLHLRPGRRLEPARPGRPHPRRALLEPLPAVPPRPLRPLVHGRPPRPPPRARPRGRVAGRAPRASATRSTTAATAAARTSPGRASTAGTAARGSGSRPGSSSATGA